jgi:hypothetical protein
MSLTQADRIRLGSYTTLPSLTPEQAADLKRTIPNNYFPDGNKCRWCWPLSDAGGSIDTTENIRQPIRAVSKGGCASNPDSLSTRAPWVELNVSRSYYYVLEAQKAKAAAILAPLPLAMRTEVKKGLKLYSALAAFATAYNLDHKGLWEQVGVLLATAQFRKPLVPKLMSEWVKEGS